jgi:acyl-CoA dehydrogenase
MFYGSTILGLADGPSEVHRITVARRLLKEGTPAEGMWPSAWIPGLQEKARKKWAKQLEGREVGS